MWVIHNECVGPDGLVRYFWIPNFNDAYVIGDDGTLWTRYTGIGSHCYLSNDWLQRYPSPDKDGYPIAVLRFNGVSYTKKIHQLVCEAVCGPCPVGLEVCHNDGKVANNWWWNLRYDTVKNNQADKVIHGTDVRGEKKPNALLNWTKAREIRAKWHSGKYTKDELALEYKVTKSCIINVIYNSTWVEV